jgi:hypothetical protein
MLVKDKPVSDTALAVLLIVTIVKPGKSPVGERGKGKNTRKGKCPLKVITY